MISMSARLAIATPAALGMLLTAVLMVHSVSLATH
ncbi:hypothetical protein FOHLNKBM_2108 [Methylobacterium longum]|nr:hypothetical protein FOHLNKBM_2108 [Methylobacterium longum]